MLLTPVAHINLSALKENLYFVRRLAPLSKCIVCVKANAYGHGLLPISRALSAAGADLLGVARVTEAVLLREAGIQTPILLLEGVQTEEELALAIQYRCQIVIHHLTQLSLLTQSQHSLRVWIKLNTGMNRLGLMPGDLQCVYDNLRNLPYPACIEGVMTHFASADQVDNPLTKQQFDCFMAAVSHLSLPKSLANSAAILAFDYTHQDWVRPGLMLYGINPVAGKGYEKNLMPVMTLRAYLISVYEVKAGEGISYNHQYICKKKTKIGIVGIGYGDGYPRYLRHKTPVLFRNTRTFILGRVCMDMLAIDLTAYADVKIGEPVELWGEDLPIYEIAKTAETSVYELLAGLTARITWEYRNNAADSK